MTKVAIITPIYKTSKFIERCAKSLFEQDFEDIEYIFVNDATPDDSVLILEQVIEQYPNRKAKTTILHHSENKGSSSARKTGFLHTRADYFISIDSDDFCEKDMVSSMYSKAIETNSDIVCADYFLSYNGRDIYKKQTEQIEAKEFFKDLLCVKSVHVLWNKLIKRDFCIKNNIYPADQINHLDDRYLAIRTYALASSITYIPRAFLHYWKENENSICKQEFNEKTLNHIQFFVESTDAFLKEKNLYKKYKKYYLLGNLIIISTFITNKETKQKIKQFAPHLFYLKNYLRVLFYSTKSSNNLSLKFKINFLLKMIGAWDFRSFLFYIKSKWNL